jgi:hypothetical protein
MGKNQDPGSGINIPDPQHCLLGVRYRISLYGTPYPKTIFRNIYLFADGESAAAAHSGRGPLTGVAMPPAAANRSIIDATGTSEQPAICRRNAAESGTRGENPSRPIRGENPSRRRPIRGENPCRRRPITWREYQPCLLLLLVSALFPMTMTRMRMLTIIVRRRYQDLVRRRRMTTTAAAAAIAMPQTGGRGRTPLPRWTTLGRVEAAAAIAGPIRCRLDQGQDRQRGGIAPSEPAASRPREVHRNPPSGAVLRCFRAETQ